MKTNNSQSLLLDFRGLGGDFFSCFGQGWCRFGLPCVVLVSEFVFLQIFGDVAPSWREDGDQERQDGRTWSKHGVAIDATGSRVDARRSGATRARAAGSPLAKATN